MPHYRFAAVVWTLAWSSVCLAQAPPGPAEPAAQPAPARPAAPVEPIAPAANPGAESRAAGSGAPVGVGPGDASAGESDATPPLPEVADPMLDLLPAPTNVLESWQQALRLVRNRSTSLSSSLTQVEVAAARARAALVRMHPTLTATGSLQQHLLFGKGTNFTAGGVDINVDIPDPSTLFNARVALRQPVLNLRNGFDVQTAKVAQRAAEQRSLDVERIVLANVADTIVAVFTAERLAEVSRVALRSSLSTLDLTRRRARLGASSAVDVLRAEQEATLNRARVVTANESLRRAREALGMALGYSEAWGVTPDIKLDRLGEDARRVCTPVPDLRDRADIRAATTDVEVARRNTEASDYALAPTLDLVSDLTYTTSSFTANGKPVQWTIGALLTVPLYDGGARTAERHLRSQEVQLAEQALTQTRLNAELQVQQSLRSVAVAEEHFAVSQRSRELSRETSRLARLSFLNGKGTSFELVDATRRFQEAELDLTVKEFEVVRARIIALLARANCDI